MFTVQVTGHTGVEAEFVVPSPVVAFDVALRATRAGLAWRAGSRDGSVPLPLAALRDLAERWATRDPAAARYLADVVGAEERAAAAARLN